MSNETFFWFRWGRWLGAGMIVLAVATVLVMRSRTTTRRLTITVDSNGAPRLGGVSLLNTNIRDGAFAAMGALGIKASLTLQPMTNATQESNVIETLKSMSRAGLFGTNQRPNPYE